MVATSEESLSVVIPVFNEEANIMPLCNRLFPVLRKLGRPFEVIFVDDGSTDGTLDVFSEAAKMNPNLKVVVLPRNFGQTAVSKAVRVRRKG